MEAPARWRLFYCGLSGGLKARRPAAGKASWAARVAFCALMVAWGWAASGERAGGQPQVVSSSTVVVAVEADLISEDPVRFVRHKVSELILGHVYGTLIRADGLGGFTAGLASDVRQMGPLHWRFELRNSVRLHDGRTLSAEHVVQSLQRATSPGALGGGLTAPSRARLEPIDQVWAEGGRYVHVRLKEPWSGFLPAMSREPVAVPGQHGRLVGAGPYVIEQWEHGNRISLIQADPLSPGPDRIVFEVIPSAAARIQAFRAGRVSAVRAPGFRDASALAAVATHRARLPSAHLFMIEFATWRPPFDDRRVRAAIAHALDVPAALAQVREGVGVPVASLYSPIAFGYDPELARRPRDVAEAKRLLAEAGYPEGFEFELDAAIGRADLALRYARMLEEAGLRPVVRIWPTRAELQDAVERRERQVWLTEWENTSLDGASVIAAKVGSGGRANFGGYSNPELDAALERAGAAALGPWREEMSRLQKMVRDEAAVIAEFVDEEIWYFHSDGERWLPVLATWARPEFSAVVELEKL